jgi:hypothetical protein
MNQTQAELEQELLGQVVDKEMVEEQRVKLNDFRRRISNGEAVPEDELRTAITSIRVLYGREAEKKKAAAKPKPKKAPAKPKKEVNIDNLMDNLFG